MLRQYQTSFGCYQIRPEKIDKGKPKQIRVTATLNLRLLQTTKRGITIKCPYRNDFMSSVFNFHGNFR